MFFIIIVWMNKNMYIKREVYLKINEYKKV